jgi:phage terminase large subunit-like protein
MAMLGLRLGKHPRAVVTTTSRPHALFRKLQKRPEVHITRGSTYDNRANLAETFFQNIVNQYEGTRLGRQELYSELLDDTPGALWQQAQIDAQRTATVPELTRIIVAIDPSATSSDTSDEAGIVGAGRGTDNHGYTLDDRTMRGTPLQWAREAIAMYHRLRANEIVAEANNGGEMVRTIIQSVDPGVPVRLVWAAQGKQTRAEPVSMLYEQGRAHHVGVLPALEDEMCSWTPYDSKSPNRIDALVWAYYGLGLTEAGKVGW